MKVSLKQKIAILSTIKLFFVGLATQKTKDGDHVAILQLEDPIPHVRGSQEVEFQGRMIPIVATDVTEIKVHEGDFTDDFQFDEEENTGSYEGSDLILDVAKNGQVWLRRESFASSGNTMRAKFRNERLAKLVSNITSGQQGATNGAKKVQPVDTTAGA